MTEATNPNMALWNKVCKTNPGNNKNAKIGQMKITAISPQSQRKKATEIFGPYGIGWGIIPSSEETIMNTFGENIIAAYKAVLFYILDGNRGEIPINATLRVFYKTSSGYWKADDEYTKKIQTDAMTKGLSTLGFNSDVFEGKFDDCKYVQRMKAEFGASNDPQQKQVPPVQQQRFPQQVNPNNGEAINNAPQQNTYAPDPITWITQYADLTELCKGANMTESAVKNLVTGCNFDYTQIKNTLTGANTNGFH